MEKEKKRPVPWHALTLLLLMLLLAACGAATGDEPSAVNLDEAAALEAPAKVTTTGPAVTATAEPKATSTEEVTMLTEDNRPERLRRLTSSWDTNWNKHSIDYDELLAGGPPRDGIPSIDDPQFIDAEEAAAWLDNVEPVIALEIDGEARGYPLQILIWHEIVNDTVGGVPVAVTFCPLCNSAITFDRRLDGEVYEFGTSGLLRNSDLVMYDRTTESLWQQFTGEAIVGDLTGAQLDFIPSTIVGFADFRETYPEGIVLSRDTGYNRSYGENPYVGYDNIGQSPFLFRGPIDGRLPAMERVVAVTLPGADVAYPYSILTELGTINDRVAGQDLVVFHSGGSASALDARVIAEAEDIGATGVFDPHVDGQKLTFTKEEETIVDEQTGSRWNVLGQALAGPLEGEELTPIVHGDHFWFSWAAFKPETIVYDGE